MNVFKGLHRGTFTVQNEQLLIRGIIHGDLRIHGEDANVDLRGMVRGDILLMDGKLAIPGIVNGNITNRGGELTVTGLVNGTITTETEGITHLGSQSSKTASREPT